MRGGTGKMEESGAEERRRRGGCNGGILGPRVVCGVHEAKSASGPGEEKGEVDGTEGIKKC